MDQEAESEISSLKDPQALIGGAGIQTQADSCQQKPQCGTERILVSSTQ